MDHLQIPKSPMKRHLLRLLSLVDPKWNDRATTYGVEFLNVFESWTLLQILFK